MKIDMSKMVQVGFENISTGKRVVAVLCLKEETQNLKTAVEDLQYALDAINRCQEGTPLSVKVFVKEAPQTISSN